MAVVETVEVETVEEMAVGMEVEERAAVEPVAVMEEATVAAAKVVEAMAVAETEGVEMAVEKAEVETAEETVERR